MNRDTKAFYQSLQYLEYASQMITMQTRRSSVSDSLLAGQKELEKAIAHFKDVHREMRQKNETSFQDQIALNNAEAEADHNVRSKKRIADSARVAAAVGRERLVEAQKSGNAQAIQEAKEHLERVTKRRIQAEQFEAAAKKERGAI